MIELALRLVVSLAVVLGLIWAIARMSGRRLGSTGSLLGVVGRQSLGRNASVQVVSVGGRLLVLGVSEHQVNLLTELDVDGLGDPSVIETVTTSEAAQPAPDARPAPARGQHAATGHRSAVGGSLLSLGTWRDAWTAVTRGSAA